MKVKKEYYRTIWVKQGVEKTIQIIDQRNLPHKFIIEDLNTLGQVVIAIKDMHVRGAGLIGATAGFGMYLAALSSESSTSFYEDLKQAAAQLIATRPTAK
jgi:methylthioribose-1-phosphate isomerase